MKNAKPLGKLSFEDKDLLKKTYADFKLNYADSDMARNFIGSCELWTAKLSSKIDWSDFSEKFLAKSGVVIDRWFAELLGNVNQIVLGDSGVVTDANNDVAIMFRAPGPDEEHLGEMTDLEKKVYISAYKQFYKKWTPVKESSPEDLAINQEAEMNWKLKVNFLFMYCHCLICNRVELQFPEFNDFAIREDCCIEEDYQIWGKRK
ncbi:MAG: hypothetical protein WCO55_05735 [Candidatus Falkowbacteria bacterium]